MKAERLINLICHPEKIESDDLKELDTLINRYPYFQAARVLYLKALNGLTNVRFRSELKANSVHIIDHKQLYKYLNNLIEFDHLVPEHEEKNSSLSDIVTDRIKEINGYIPVNTQGIPAHKNVRTTITNTGDDILDINFGAQMPANKVQPKAPAPTNTPPLRQETTFDQNVISNPIILDNIPGIVGDYSETTSNPVRQKQDTYEVINHSGSQAYIIEPVNTSYTIDLSEITGTVEEYEDQESELSPIGSIQEEDHLPVIDDKKGITSETGKQTDKKQTLDTDLPDMQSAYLLEHSFPGEIEENSIDELANSLKKKNSTKEGKTKVTKRDKSSLIDKFIEEEPTIPKGNLESVSEGDLSQESNVEKEDLFSETLAKIYVKQKLYEKAIASYIKLSLKYPEKSVYFANRIEKIKDKINNNE